MTTIRVAQFAVYSLAMLIVCIYGSSADTGFRDELLARMHALEDQGKFSSLVVVVNYYFLPYQGGT